MEFIGRGSSQLKIGPMPHEDCGENGLCFYIAVAHAFKGLNKNYSIYLNLVRTLGTPAGKDVQIDDIHLVENDDVWSQFSIAIHVLYRDDDGDILPVRSSRVRLAKNEIVLMLFHTKTRSGQPRMHYAYVSEPLKLFRYKTSRRREKYRLYPCYNCMNYFWSQNALDKHKLPCQQREPRAVRMPEPGTKMSFAADKLSDEGKSLAERSFKTAFLAFFDVETLCVDDVKSCSCPPSVLENTRRLKQEEEEWAEMSEEEKVDFVIARRMNASWSDSDEILKRNVSALAQAELDHEMMIMSKVTSRKRRKMQRPRFDDEKPLPVCHHKLKTLKEHKAFMVSYMMCDREGQIIDEQTFVGLDCFDSFMRHLVDMTDRLVPTLSPGKPYLLTEKDRAKLLQIDHCHICNNFMTPSQKVIDHDHLTGKIVGVAHNICNLNRKERHHVTCFAHNMSGFDSHFAIKAIGDKPSWLRSVDGLANNREKFKTLTINGNIRFTDSTAFLPGSLSQLTDQLRASNSKFRFMEDLVTCEEEKQLLIRKGVFPFAAATSVDRLYATTSLPPMKDFYDVMHDEHITREDFTHALKVWETFQSKNLMEYAVLYCKTDVRLLAEIIFDMREKIWAEFKLDICAYLSLPQLSKDMWLKYTAVEVDLMHDQDMAQTIMDNIRGGLCFINQRSVGAGSLHEKMELKLYPNSKLFYVDQNNLYGFCLSMMLPWKNFRWMTPKEVAAFNPLTDIDPEGEKGFILEVDLDYPESLHVLHSSFPLAPENISITEDMLSPYSSECLKTVYGQTRYKAKKLTSTFQPRRNYLVHGKNLLYYIKSGLKLTKIHRIVTFTQGKIIAPYIEYCTRMRREAKTETEKNYWKVRRFSVSQHIFFGKKCTTPCGACKQ